MHGRGALVTPTIERLLILPSEPENKNNKAQLDLAGCVFDVVSR